MAQRTIKMADICLSGFVFMICFMILYFTLERLGIMPVIGLYYPDMLVFYWQLNEVEFVFMLAFITQLSWIGGQVIYAKLRKYEVMW